MTPRRMQTLQTLIEHAQAERDGALADYQQAQAQERQAQAQAEQLARYRQDYDARWGAQPGRAGSVTLLHCAHGFMQRLEQARQQQQRQCEHCAQRTLQARSVLQARELRLAAVRKLVERRLQAAEAVAERRAQKATDEAAQRMAWAARRVTGFH